MQAHGRHARGAGFARAYDKDSNPIHQIKPGLDDDRDAQSRSFRAEIRY